MKRFSHYYFLMAAFAVLAVGLQGCSGVSSKQAQATVQSFLTASSSAEHEPNNDKMLAFLSDKYFKDQNKERSAYLVNYYTFDQYDILKTEGDMVYARIKNTEYRWYRDVVFKVAKENGKVVIVPSSSDPMDEDPELRYSDPWWKVEDAVDY